MKSQTIRIRKGRRLRDLPQSEQIAILETHPWMIYMVPHPHKILQLTVIGIDPKMKKFISGPVHQEVKTFLELKG